MMKLDLDSIDWRKKNMGDDEDAGATPMWDQLSEAVLVCRIIDSYPLGTNLLDRIFAGVSIYYNYTGTVDCFDLEDDPHGMSGWNWQACTEMVMPMSSSPENSMFPAYYFDYATYQDQCLQSYGARPQTRWITTEFGGHNIRTALNKFGSNLIFSNGVLDPWSGGSVLQNISESVIALVTELGAHHIDLRASTREDPKWLTDQRKTEINVIRGWIYDYYHGSTAATLGQTSIGLMYVATHVSLCYLTDL